MRPKGANLRIQIAVMICLAGAGFNIRAGDTVTFSESGTASKLPSRKLGESDFEQSRQLFNGGKANFDIPSLGKGNERTKIDPRVLEKLLGPSVSSSAAWSSSESYDRDAALEAAMGIRKSEMEQSEMRSSRMPWDAGAKAPKSAATTSSSDWSEDPNGFGSWGKSDKGSGRLLSGGSLAPVAASFPEFGSTDPETPWSDAPWQKSGSLVSELSDKTGSKLPTLSDGSLTQSKTSRLDDLLSRRGDSVERNSKSLSAVEQLLGGQGRTGVGTFDTGLSTPGTELLNSFADGTRREMNPVQGRLVTENPFGSQEKNPFEFPGGAGRGSFGNDGLGKSVLDSLGARTLGASSLAPAVVLPSGRDRALQQPAVLPIPRRKF